MRYSRWLGPSAAGRKSSLFLENMFFVVLTSPRERFLYRNTHTHTHKHTHTLDSYIENILRTAHAQLPRLEAARTTVRARARDGRLGTYLATEGSGERTNHAESCTLRTRTNRVIRRRTHADACSLKASRPGHARADSLPLPHVHGSVPQRFFPRTHQSARSAREEKPDAARRGRGGGRAR